MKIYTKTGDQGETSLLGGHRVSKSEMRIQAYGEVDELNSQIGKIAALLSDLDGFTQDKEFLEIIQSDLFVLGSNLATLADQREKFKLRQLLVDDILKLEKRLDEREKDLVPLKSFILPGGHLIAAELHLARTVCRRVERGLVYFDQNKVGELPENSIQYLNRLSDFLFVLARYVNKKTGAKEVLWQG